MSLASDLEQLGANLPDNQLPSVAAVRPVLGALVLAIEHGQEFVSKFKDDPEGLLSAIAEHNKEEAESKEVSSPPDESSPTSSSPASGTGGFDTPTSPAAAELEAQKESDPTLALRAENENLRQQVQNLIAQFQRTQVGESTPAEGSQ